MTGSKSATPRSALPDSQTRRLPPCVAPPGDACCPRHQRGFGDGATKAPSAAYVSFRDVDDFRRFLSCFDGTVLSERRFATPYLFDPATGTRRPVHRRGWKRAVYVKELEPGQTPDGPGEFRMPARLGFAAADIPEMERVLRAIVEATIEHVESNVPDTVRRP